MASGRGMFTLDVCVYVTVEVRHCVNSNANIDTENEFRPNLCVCICVTIDTMLNFDGEIDANADIKCEQSISQST